MIMSARGTNALHGGSTSVESKKAFYDSKARFYAVSDKESLLRYRKAMELANVSNGARILDVGCKRAVLHSLLEMDGRRIDYFGLDISHRLIRELREVKYVAVCDVMSGLQIVKRRRLSKRRHYDMNDVYEKYHEN